uniref:Cysteine proteinase inhibitor n=1 Tax=Heliothis virescens TaxID=7102 RepID=A0A2A4K985_HELVI
MNNHNNYFLVVYLLLISSCLCEIIISGSQREKFLTGFVEHYNNLPNQIYQSNEGLLQSVQQLDDVTYRIVANIRATEIHDVEATKDLECTATIQESEDDDVTVINHVCHELVPSTTTENAEDAETEAQAEGTVTSRRVQLENEVQSDTAVTSGEQFIAIPRDQPSAPCIGCALHINPQAPGVSDLASLGVRHLDIHEPSAKHSLDTVIDVERQVQVVNGVRYILTLLINSNNCTDVQTENCIFPKTCKVTILVKPWIKLSNGHNYRSILANNCTEPWLYGDDGEIVHEPSNDNDIQVKHHTDVQSVPNQERTLTEDELRSLQEQIIPNTEFKEPAEPFRQLDTTSPSTLDVSKEHVFKVESDKHTENSVPVTESHNTEQQSFKKNLDTDKKKAIDDMLDFFNFSGFKPKAETEDVVSRVRRSYDYDLQVLSLAKDYHGIKNSIENARFMYEMAQAMVDYLNEMDMEIKNRVVNDVVKAEEETENLQRFVYIQARVTIPCDKVECKPVDVVTQICNGVIDSTNTNSPQILNTFCYNENKERDFRKVVKEIPLDDPILQKLAEEALKKIETESKSQNALKISRIASAITQLTSGTLTKFSLIIENVNCKKNVPLMLRMNCTVIEQPGSKICEVIVHERHWLNERKISYTCTDRPVEMRISKALITKNVTVDDPKVAEMLQEAIQYLETQSERNNKQKIVNINSISSQIIAGFLTKIEFVAGYTNCTDETNTRTEFPAKCEVLKDEGLRLCKAQIWDRSWIMDGRQVEVSCDDVLKSNEVQGARKKRSIDSTGEQNRPSGSEHNQIDYKKLAEDSLNKFMLASTSRQHYAVMKVEKVKAHDKHGKLIRLLFSISPTNCYIKSDELLSSPKCVVVNPKNIFHCRSDVLQKGWIDKKQYFINCNVQDNDKSWNSDGIKEQNLNNPKYYQLAEESLKKYMHGTENVQNHRVVRLEKVTTKVVSGLLTDIDFIISPITPAGSSNKTVKCHSKIFEKQWLGTKDFDVSCQLAGNQNHDSHVKNLEDPRYMQMAVEALEKYIQNKDESNLIRVTFVDEVEEQEGKSIKIRFMASHNEDDNGDTLCYAQFLETQKPQNVTCRSIGTVLKENEVTEDDPKFSKYVQWAEESLNDYLQSINNSQLYTIASIESVKVQWDGSVKTLIKFIITPIDIENSEIQGKICLAEIKDHIWLNKNKKDKNIKCEPAKELYRAKREARLGINVVGGITEQDAKNPHYMELAEQSLRKYLSENPHITQSPGVVPVVEKVTTQVVTGSMTRINFHFQASGAGSQQDHKTMKCHAEIWERPWLQFKEINVTCFEAKAKVRRDLAGGITEQDAKNPHYMELAEQSMRKYLLENPHITQAPGVVPVVDKVTTQVVAGSMTRIDFHFQASGTGSQQDHKTMKCHAEIWERPWLQFKEINVTCFEDKAKVRRDLAGGITEQDPKNPDYIELAKQSMHKYLSENPHITQSPGVIPVIEKVTTQVVAGSLTRIDFHFQASGTGSQQDHKTMKCHAEIWERPWLQFKEINVTCFEDKAKVRRNVPGGITEQDSKNPDYIELAKQSMHKYLSENPHITQSPGVIPVIEKVTTQVVAGSLTRIDFHFQASGTGSQQNHKTMKCHAEVWERPWLQLKEINVTCFEAKAKVRRDVPGGITEQDPKNPHYMELAEQSLRKYLSENPHITQSPGVIPVIEKVTTQVVAGSLTRIDFHFQASGTGSQQDHVTMKCHAEVWERPWLQFKEINVTCFEAKAKVRRDLAGGITEQDPKNPDYIELATQSLHKYLSENPHITQSPGVVPVVDKVTTQVVAGSMTRIDFHFQASGTGSQQDHKTMKCHAEVWERPWLESKTEITVSCAYANKRVKRHLRVPSHTLKHNSLKYEVLDDEKNSHQKEKDATNNLRGHTEEVKDPSKPEYKILAEEALRKYQLKTTVYHKVLEVKTVVTRVVSGLKYIINFNAAPTTCLLNVTSVRARSCKPVADVILYCHTEIWDRPWLKLKKIDVNCYGDDSEESDTDLSLKPGNVTNNSSEKYMKLAEDASEQYLTTSNRKYVHKVTEILNATEQVANGTITTVAFSISPTTCLRNDTTKTSCNLKQPVVVFHCNAVIRERPLLEHEKEIEVTCKKRSERKTKKEKRDIGVRDTRQTVDDDDEMDDETTFYYADRAIQHMNDNSNSNNLHKLISIHAAQSSMQMGTITVQMYLEVAETFCLRQKQKKDLQNCEEMNGLTHRLCLARLWPSPDDELVVRHVSVVCDDDEDFTSITGVNIPELLKMSIADLERAPEAKYKLVHQGEPQVIPTLDSKSPFKLNFFVATTNCSVDVNLDDNPFQCFLNTEIPSKSCHSFIWLETETKFVRYINAKCSPIKRVRRSSLDSTNTTSDKLEIQKMVQDSLEKLEMTSLHRYKQRVLQINSFSTKITSGKVTTIDFDVGYTSCLKYEWVANITTCDFLEHLPRRRCVAQVRETLWINNGQNIDVSCSDDETPLEAHIEFESAEMARELAREALKHIEAKYPHPNKQKVVRIFSLEKQVVAGIHYRMKIEVGFTDCDALSDQTDCKLLKDHILNKFCRVNVWVRPWTDHPPNFRVTCDFQEGTTHDLYYQVQAEHLFYNFLTTYSPSYVNDYSQMQKRFEIFKKNVKKMHELNVHEKGTARYGVTRFADLTYEEFSSTYMGLKTNLTNENQVPMKMADIPDIKVPASFDWRQYDAVTEVKDQGACGSCWAFSVTGNIEGQWKMQSGKLVSLSEQELVDCDKMDDGCNGGLPDNAYRAIEQMGGLELESDYPYEGVDEKCLFNKTLAKVQISGAVNITKNETGMTQWLVHNGPISIGINANAMQFYMGGISHPWKMLCNPTNLDHGVLIVGYGIKDYPLFHKKLPYWIVKNSWGKSWGEQGYYRVYRGDGTCGVNQMASSAVI